MLPTLRLKETGIFSNDVKFSSRRTVEGTNHPKPKSKAPVAKANRAIDQYPGRELIPYILSLTAQNQNDC
jgi:hypothetical protein